jgi:hypothetical protein
MEEQGIVGPAEEGGRSREVLSQEDDFDDSPGDND